MKLLFQQCFPLKSASSPACAREEAREPFIVSGIAVYKVLACSCSVSLSNIGADSLGHIGALADLLQHVPPGSTSLCPALGDLIVVAQVRHQNLILLHGLVVSPDLGQVGAFSSGTCGEEVGNLNSLCGVLGVSEVLDEGLGSLDLGGIAVVEDTEAPDTALQLGLAGLSGECHADDLVAGNSLAGAGACSVGIQLLLDVPAVSNLQNALVEQLDLVAANDSSVEVNTLGVAEGLDSLNVQGIVPGVLGVLSIGEGAAVQVVDQSTGALVAALAAAEDSGNGAGELSLNSCDSLQAGCL